MKLTVLGCQGPYPGANGACSGYIVESRSNRLLLDCGNGVLSNLQTIYDLKDIKHIILSHFHSDHIGDIGVLKYAVMIQRMKGIIKEPINLYIPPYPEEEIEKIEFKDSFNIHVVEEGKNYTIEDFEVCFFKTKHPILCYGVNIFSGGKKITYSADSAYDYALVKAAMGSHLFLCEAGILEKDYNESTAHLTPKQARIIAEEAHVKRLILTHFWEGYDIDCYLEEAGEGNGIIIELAEKYKSFYV